MHGATIKTTQLLICCTAYTKHWPSPLDQESATQRLAFLAKGTGGLSKTKGEVTGPSQRDSAGGAESLNSHSRRQRRSVFVRNTPRPPKIRMGLHSGVS